jgi:hypothetical protein
MSLTQHRTDATGRYTMGKVISSNDHLSPCGHANLTLEPILRKSQINPRMDFQAQVTFNNDIPMSAV